jgi:beta-lactamase class A
MQGMGGTGSARGRLGASAVLLCLLLGALPAASRAESLRLPGERPRSGAPSDADALWNAGSPDLQHALVGAMNGLRLGRALAEGQLSVSLIDITDLGRPRVAAINGDAMFYAASLPKIAIMLAVFEKAERGALTLDRETRGQLERMIRRSSNGDSTALLHKVGKPFVAEVLSSDRYRLYDPRHNGGLWCGKDYAPSGLWRRDPLANLSHGATAMQVARFFYLLERGELVSPVASRRMKSLLAHSEIDHKFVRGLREIRPRASIYRKSGTWRNYHADGGIVERRDGVRYIAVALSTRHEARYWFPRIIVAMDRLFDAAPKPLQAAPTTARLPDDAFAPRSSYVGH